MQKRRVEDATKSVSRILFRAKDKQKMRVRVRLTFIQKRILLLETML
jgi:hypothetical protein